MTILQCITPPVRTKCLWTQAEIAALREWSALTHAEIAARLGRSRMSVLKKRAELGLNPQLTFEERFEAKIDRSAGPDGCHVWTASTYPWGYGKMGIGNHRVDYAHRIAWRLAKGPIPKGMIVCHSCDNPPCVNPAHLFLGTHGTNSDDKIAKGRDVRGERCGSAKLTASVVIEMRQLRAASGLSYREIGARFGISGSAAQCAIVGKTWGHV